MRPPLITWFTGFLMLGSALLLMAAAGLEAWALEELTDALVWGVLIGLGFVQIVGALFMPIAARWSTLLCWLITMATGVGGVAAGWMWGTPAVFGFAWSIFAGLACLGAAFFCFISFFFVHHYRSQLDDLIAIG
ncbi:MAG: hypothetical protein KC912_05450 [Proteobacteria bacterium]|nr:hypothetical protein [Pseudomonadota bacterium]